MSAKNFQIRPGATRCDQDQLRISRPVLIQASGVGTERGHGVSKKLKKIEKVLSKFIKRRLKISETRFKKILEIYNIQDFLLTLM